MHACMHTNIYAYINPIIIIKMMIITIIIV